MTIRSFIICLVLLLSPVWVHGQDTSANLIRLNPQVIAEMNEANRRVSRHWLLEYQRTEDLFRIRVVPAPFDSVVGAFRKALNEVGLAVLGWDAKSEELIAENYGPNPLTIEEWKVVTQQEEQEARKVGGPYFAFAPDPKEYLVQLRIKFVKLDSERVAILLDYAIDAPRYRRLGIIPTTVAPPSAVQYASLKLWALLDSQLVGLDKPKSRRRLDHERAI